MRHRVGLPAVIAALALLGCGAKDATTPPVAAGSSTSTTAAAANAPGTTGTVGTSPAPGTTVKAGCTNALTLVNAAAATETPLTDRALAIVTAWSDRGPHPSNTVDDDKELDLMLTESVVPVDKQFGYSIPVGDPHAPDGKIYLEVDLTNPTATVAVGQRYVGSTSTDTGDGTIRATMYSGSTRLLPGDFTVTITELTDDIVCGTISTVTKTSLQTFLGVEGTFRVDRVQALEAKTKK